MFYEANEIVSDLIWQFLLLLFVGTFVGAWLVDYFFPVGSDNQRHWKYEQQTIKTDKQINKH